MRESVEFTFRAVLLGVLLSLAMAAANTYLGLKVGLTISANIPCSVLALILFHSIMRTKSIAEVNLAQATGSVGEGIAAGVVFVFPALVLSEAFRPFSSWGAGEYAAVTVAVLAGSTLGVVLTGFLREPMVVRSKELKYPEGVATAEVLKTGMAAFGQGRRQGMIGVATAFVGGIGVKVFSSGIAVLDESVSTAFRIGNSAFKVGSDISAALVGVGFIVEFNGAALVAMGGLLAWFVFIPVFTALYPAQGSAQEIAEAMWAGQVRYIGVGGMIIGGLWSIFKIRQQLAAGIRSAIDGFTKSRSGHTQQGEGTVQDLPHRITWVLIGLGMLLAVGVYYTNVGAVGATISSVYTALAVFFFVAVSVYIVGLIGSTNQPVSGITICTFLLAALFLLAGGLGGTEAVRTVLLIAGVVCLAACLSGTAAQNFKTALAVGGTPRALQAGLLIAVAVTSLLAAPLMAFLDGAFRIGSERLLAPQATMFAAMARGLFMEGSSLPWNMVALGMGLAVVLILAGEWLRHRGSSFGISPMAVAVGIYLPFTTTLPILLGGLIQLLLTLREKDASAFASAMQKGTVLCAGLVAGEALTGIFLAVPVGFDVQLPLPGVPWEPLRAVLALLTLICLPLLIHRSIRGRPSSSPARESPSGR